MRSVRLNMCVKCKNASIKSLKSECRRIIVKC